MDQSLKWPCGNIEGSGGKGGASDAEVIFTREKKPWPNGWMDAEVSGGLTKTFTGTEEALALKHILLPVLLLPVQPDRDRQTDGWRTRTSRNTLSSAS